MAFSSQGERKKNNLQVRLGQNRMEWYFVCRGKGMHYSHGPELRLCIFLSYYAGFSL